ncbi:HTTM domain-containing protein [Streptomyces sp. NPDC057638]|uniref:HTTM domain-containing protein n=1 Tax=Streptomyces sp. NPDC057638 TaxID=3346190 RepID=UPI0036C2E997
MDAAQRITAEVLGPYQTAVVRMGFAGTWLFFLVRELPHRHELYGPDGPWSWESAHAFVGRNDAFTVLLWSRGDLWFELVYALALVSAALLLVGWRTRTMSALFMVGVLSLQNRSIFMGDGGDNVIHLMAVYLLFTRCGRVWSLDARRAARRPPGRDVVGPLLWTVLGAALLIGTLVNQTGWQMYTLLWALWLAQALWWTLERRAPDGQPRLLLDALSNLLHNAGLLVIMVEVCLIYATAGWYKVQGSRWQEGTALYYPLNLDYFTPWPALSDLLASGGVIVMVVTYGTVVVQVAFPFTLFQRRVKNVLLAVMMIEHLAIAVLLGLPFFSLAMIAADAVFLPTVFLLWAGTRVGRGRTGLLARMASARAAVAARSSSSARGSSRAAPGAVARTPEVTMEPDGEPPVRDGDSGAVA